MNKKYSTLFLCAAFAVGAQAAEGTAKADVLGRHISSVGNTPKAYVKDVKKNVNSQKTDPSKPRSLAKVSYYPSETSIATTYATFESRPSGTQGGMGKYYTLNGLSVSETTYKSRIKKIEDADQARKQYKNSHPVSHVNYQNSNLYNVVRSNSNCTGQASCQLTFPCYSCTNGVESIELWNYTSILYDRSNIGQHTDQLGYNGENIGISMTHRGMPLMSYNHAPADRFSILYYTQNVEPSYIAGATGNARVLNKVATGAKVYGVQRLCGNSNEVLVPTDGYDLNPQIFIGTHSFGCGQSTSYQNTSRNIDDFVYNTRTIEFAAAANNGRDGGAVSDVGLGLNVITVGAVHNSPNNQTYHQTSTWQNPTFRNSSTTYVKPEIAEYADFLFPEFYSVAIGKDNTWHTVDPYYSYTAAAAPYAAATTAMLLERYPFYKWHPEAVKSLLIASSVKPITNASSHDSDNQGKYAMGVPEGNAMFWNNRSRFWNGNNEDFFDGDSNIVFSETGIRPNTRYRIAIAWLSNGSYVYDYGRIPQDIDLSVYEGNSSTSSASSSSGPNPFELVDFTTKSTTNSLRIVIHRFRNDGGRVLLGYTLVEL